MLSATPAIAYLAAGPCLSTWPITGGSLSRSDEKASAMTLKPTPRWSGNMVTSIRSRWHTAFCVASIVPVQNKLINTDTSTGNTSTF